MNGNIFGSTKSENTAGNGLTAWPGLQDPSSLPGLSKTKGLETPGTQGGTPWSH